MKKVKSNISLLGWLRSPIGISLFVFVFGSVFLSGYGQQRALGIFLAAVFFVSYMFRIGVVVHRLFPAPPELLCYTGWVAWASVTGLFTAQYINLFVPVCLTVLQMLALVWGIYAVIRLRPETMPSVFLALACGGILQVYSVYTGFMVPNTPDASERMVGITNNPNTLGIMLITVTIATLVLWGYAEHLRTWVRVGLLAVVPFFAYGILVSGSRKSTLAFLFLCFGWAYFASSKKRRSPLFGRHIVITTLIVVIIYSFMPKIMQETSSGQRFNRLYSKSSVQDVDSLTSGRYSMYEQGIDLFLKYPIAGVGLDNYKAYNRKFSYSHSDYIEPLATTGLIGFCLYHSFYFFILRRIARLLQQSGSVRVENRLRMIVISVLTIMLIGLGTPHYNNPTVYILLICFSAYTHQIERSLQRQATISSLSGSRLQRLSLRRTVQAGTINTTA